MPSPVGSLLFRTLRVYQVYGANTEVGKTIFTTLLCKAARDASGIDKVSYLKPISTGPAHESDERYAISATNVRYILVSNCLISCHRHIRQYALLKDCKTLFQFRSPVSPHLAAREVGKPPEDQLILQKCCDYASALSKNDKQWLFIETAGGVHSPGPQGNSQAEMFTPLRPPAILVGDSRLGGISQTISAFESLKIRGYGVEALLLFQNQLYQNAQYLADYFRERNQDLIVKSIPGPPPQPTDCDENRISMMEYYSSRYNELSDVLQHLDTRHVERITRLECLATKAHKSLWLPFTQQQTLSPEGITVIDSAHGDHLHTFRGNDGAGPTTSSGLALTQESFDGSASWWTQGLGHGNSNLALAAAYAAGRYGHVMFAEAVHEPAMALAEQLLQDLQNERLSRVFYSDNGSTAVEVALKMGLRAARVRYGWNADGNIEILGLRDGYHGDTIGAMDCAEPCIYNKQVEWYNGKGYWFAYPSVVLTDGRWVLKVPSELEKYSGNAPHFEALEDIFDVETREGNGEHEIYEQFITDKLLELHRQGRKFGALILEPVVLGAGGMILVDPLFQRSLVNVVRKSAPLFRGSGKEVERQHVRETDWTGLPVIFDEVFTGLYRLGRATSASFLGVKPDISVHAKLLTGGVLPLSVTLASENIFEAFKSKDKSDALLHGHSYTGHAIGCQVAVESLTEMRRMQTTGEWDWAKSYPRQNLDVESPGENRLSLSDSTPFGPRVWSVWSPEFVRDLSLQTEHVSGVWALGTVLAIHLRDEFCSGYASNRAARVRDKLQQGVSGDNGLCWNIHSRVLGNVIYLMTNLKTKKERVSELECLVRSILLTRSYTLA